MHCCKTSTIACRLFFTATNHDTWLTAPLAESRKLRELLVPFEAELMTRYEVSSMVNSPRNNTPACAERVMPANNLFSDA